MEYPEYNEVSVDTDVLPTMLIYRDSELVYNWVRVDWEAGAAGIEELLTKCVTTPFFLPLAWFLRGGLIDTAFYRKDIHCWVD